ncbi:MAG: NUDIX hydrolase [Clostridiales bacterium]|jgi:ADP-ribose pyrophosphatase|nr:NUDIX hydrolase [Bacillota bacterium]NLK04073.1 NUDIX hydrolase [Clostridiales bacterium]
MVPYKRIKRDLSFKGKIIDFYSDTILIDNDKKVTFDFVDHKGASAIIPVDKDDKILMVRQYRNAIDDYTLEIPAGCLDLGEDNLTCAIRECEEETGYKPNNVKHLIDVHTTVAFSNELIKVYYSNNLSKTSQNLDEDEYIDVEGHSIEELIEMIYQGKITDAKTIAGLLAYKQKCFYK